MVDPFCVSPEAWPGKQYYDAVYYQMPDSMKLGLGPFGPERLAFLKYTAPQPRKAEFVSWFPPTAYGCVYPYQQERPPELARARLKYYGPY